MKVRAVVGLFSAFILIGGVWLITLGLDRARSRQVLENKRAELMSALSQLQAHPDEERLIWYYAFREVEETDDRAWELAARKVSSEITTKSNALAKVNEDLEHLRTSQSH